MITRRHFLLSGGALGVSAILPKSLFADGYLPDSPAVLRAETVDSRFFGNDIITRSWGYNGMSPGPTLFARKGENIRVRFKNTLPQPSTIHWHGIRVQNPMDGVPDMTQDLVHRGEWFDYDFTCPDAGTYWYHTHNKSWEQLSRGLYGPLIVLDDTPPPVDRDIIVIVDDWRLNQQGQIVADWQSVHDMSHNGRLGNTAAALFRDTMSSQAPQSLRKNERVRFRIINPATDRIFTLRLTGATYKVVAYDGMALPRPESRILLPLSPAQRIDIIADITGDIFSVDFVYNKQILQLGSLPVIGKTAPKTTAIPALAAHNLPAPDIKYGTRHTMILDGGAMSRRAMGAMMRSTDSIWALNDISAVTDTPMFRFKQGETGRIRMVNKSRFDHVMHIHGHHSQYQPKPTQYYDSVFVGANKTVTTATVFDNPGKWLVHCHMLGHQVSGMKSWIQVI